MSKKIKQLGKKSKEIFKKVNVPNLIKYKYAIIIGLSILVLALVLFFVFKKPAYVSITDKELDSLNFDIKNEFDGSQVLNKDSLDKVSELLTKRKNLLKKEFFENPSLVSKYSLSSDVKSKIPTDLLLLVEKDAKIKGDLNALDTYGINGESSINYKLEYKENGSSKSAEVFFSDKQSPLNDSTNVEVSGVYLDSYILTSSSQINTAETINNSDNQNLASNPSGSETAKEDRVLVVKVRFKDSITGDSALENVGLKGVVDGVDSYYRQNSFNKYKLKLLEVTDWVTLPYSKDDSCDVNYGTKWSKYTTEAVYGLGYDASKFDRAIYQYYGLGNYCTSKTPGDGTPIKVAGYGGGNSITSFTSASFRVYAHELGHCLGLGHASTDYKCDGNGNCTWNEYGNPYDIMGSGSDFSVANMLKLGWLDQSRVIDTSKSGQYEIYNPTVANLRDPKKPLLISSLDNIDSPYVPRGQSTRSVVSYSYYQYYGAGSFMGNDSKKTYMYGNVYDGRQLYLIDFDYKNPSFLSIPGNSVITGNASINVTSYDNDKIVFNIVGSSSFTFNKIDIRAPYYSSGSDMENLNYKIAAGEKVDLAAKTYATVSNRSMGIVEKTVQGFDYDWNDANSFGIFDSTVAGLHSVSASKSGVTSNIVKIMVNPLELSKIAISPNTPQEVIVNQPIQFTANGRDKYNNNVATLAYSWTGADTNGLFTASKPGDYQVKVSGGGFESGIVNIKVKPAPLDNIIIDPDTAKTIEVGESVQFKAYGKDQYGNNVDGVVYGWSGTDANGLFTSKSPGTYQIKVTSGNISSKEIVVVVKPAPLDHIIISPNSTQTINVGQTVQFTAQGQDQFNNNISDLTYEWVGADTNGVYTGKLAGIYSVKAASGSINSASVSVVVVKPDGGTVKTGDTKDSGVSKPVLTTIAKNGEEGDISSDDNILLINDDKLSLSGTSSSGSTVTVFVGDKSYETTTTPNGDWKAEVPSNELDKGTYEITAQAKKGDSSSEKVKIAQAEVLGVSTKKDTTQSTEQTTNNVTKNNNTKTQSLFDNPIVIGIMIIVNLAVVGGGSYIVLKRYFNR